MSRLWSNKRYIANKIDDAHNLRIVTVPSEEIHNFTTLRDWEKVMPNAGSLRLMNFFYYLLVSQSIIKEGCTSQLLEAHVRFFETVARNGSVYVPIPEAGANRQKQNSCTAAGKPLQDAMIPDSWSQLGLVQDFLRQNRISQVALASHYSFSN